jgi:hypothetical protein
MTDVLWPTPETVARAQLPKDAIECWSVTTILQVLERGGLTYWLQQQVAKTAHSKRDALAHLSQKEAVQLLLKRDNWLQEHELSDMKLGTEVHKVLEHMVLDGTWYVDNVHAEALPFIQQFMDWYQTMQPEYTAAEATVFHPELLYAGTLDAICNISGQSWLVDYKTTRNPYTPQGKLRNPYVEWSLQLAAYRYAPYVCAFRPYVTDDPRSPRRYYISKQDLDRALPMPQVDGCAILQLTQDAWRMYPVAADETARDAFLQARSLQHYVDVVGQNQFGPYVEGRHK